MNLIESIEFVVSSNKIFRLLFACFSYFFSSNSLLAYFIKLSVRDRCKEGRKGVVLHQRDFEKHLLSAPGERSRVSAP